MYFFFGINRLVLFYGISTIVGYLMPDSFLYLCILNNLVKHKDSFLLTQC